MPDDDPLRKRFDAVAQGIIPKRDQQVSELQEQLTQERDERREERFVFLVVIVILLNVIFFSFMPSFGGPLAILILELLVLIPLARRMGMEEIAQILSRVIDRVASRPNGDAA